MRYELKVNQKAPKYSEEYYKCCWCHLFWKKKQVGEKTNHTPQTNSPKRSKLIALKYFQSSPNAFRFCQLDALEFLHFPFC